MLSRLARIPLLVAVFILAACEQSDSPTALRGQIFDRFTVVSNPAGGHHAVYHVMDPRGYAAWN